MFVSRTSCPHSLGCGPDRRQPEILGPWCEDSDLHGGRLTMGSSRTEDSVVRALCRCPTSTCPCFHHPDVLPFLKRPRGKTSESCHLAGRALETIVKQNLRTVADPLIHTLSFPGGEQPPCSSPSPSTYTFPQWGPCAVLFFFF